MKYLEGFSWAVPVAFLDAVGQCRFEEGDMLYDTPQAYDLEWAEARTHIQRSIQVRFPARMAGASDKESGSTFKKNWTSEVRLDLYEKLKKVRSGHVTTQGRLYSALWRGDISVLDDSTPAPKPPTRLNAVLKQIDRVNGIAKELGMGRPVFVMPLDRANRISLEKLSKVEAQLRKHIAPSVHIVTPTMAGLPNPETIAPTVAIAFFPISGLSAKELEAAIKAAVYVPSKTSTKEVFRLSAHGAVL